MTDPVWDRLDAAWTPARQAGVLGSASVEELRRHAAGYVPAACGVLGHGIDLGSGAGVPGVILALLHPASTWHLVDASERRCSLLRRVVHEMELDERVIVHHARAEDLGHDATYRDFADLVVARLLGPVAETVEVAVPLLDADGVAVISVDDASANRASAASVAGLSLQVRSEDVGAYLEVRRTGDVPASWPRRTSTRRRAPLF
ncbi:MAG: RsmG family class I SAM-dependent methyltransferase [Acidimicrobiales bacterium]|nr:RsmG family class I SAM-dependent methyltransferase [Acidimicrobiales bacterium]